MDKLIVTVTEIKEDGEVRTLTQQLNYDGLASNLVEVFRTIMYWLTFCPSTINENVKSKYDEAE